MLLTDEQIARIDLGHCPDCNYRGFILGPRGGSAINIECGNIECLARFNVSTGPLDHHIVLAQRIHKRADGGSLNWGWDPLK